MGLKKITVERMLAAWHRGYDAGLAAGMQQAQLRDETLVAARQQERALMETQHGSSGVDDTDGD